MKADAPDARTAVTKALISRSAATCASVSAKLLKSVLMLLPPLSEKWHTAVAEARDLCAGKIHVGADVNGARFVGVVVGAEGGAGHGCE